jgi:hypothetical protein
MTRAVAAFVLTLATAASASDAWKIVRRTSIDGGAHEVQTEYWERGRVVVDDPAQRTTVDFRAGTATVVDKERRTTSDDRARGPPPRAGRARDARRVAAARGA